MNPLIDTLPVGPARAASERTATAAPIGRTDLLSLSTRTNRQASVRAVSHFGVALLIGVAILLLAHSAYPLLVIPLIAIQAYVVAFLFTAVHECAHKTAFRSRRLNLIVGNLAGATIALPYEYYCLFHWDHHRFTQDPERDPELLFAQVVPGSAPRLAIWFSGVIHLALRIRLLFRHAVTGKVTAPWVAADKRALVVREARIYAAVYGVLLLASIGLQSTILLWAWVIPLFLGQIFLRPYLLAEHTGCDSTRSAFENTRTTHTNRLVHWFAWNMPFHVEHHAYPSVPFHALPALNQVVGRHARFRATEGYLGVTASNWRWFRAIGKRRQHPPL